MLRSLDADFRLTRARHACCLHHPASPCLQTEMIQRLSAGARSGRASTAEKALEKLTADGTLVDKPFVPKRR